MSQIKGFFTGIFEIILLVLKSINPILIYKKTTHNVRIINEHGKSGVWFIVACMFFTGAGGLVAEYNLSTVASYLLGNTNEKWVIIISSMLLMMGVAGFVQKFISDNYLIIKFVILESILSLLIGFAPLIIYWAYANLYYSEFVIYGVALVIGFGIGYEIPLALRINEKYNPAIKDNIALIHFADYVGSFVGAIAFLWLLSNVPLTMISFIFAGLNFLVLSLTILHFINKEIASRKLIPLIPLIIFTLLVGANRSTTWTDVLEQRLYEGIIKYSFTTRYQHIVVTVDPSIADTTIYINGNTQLSSRDEVRYHEELVHPVMSIATNRDSVLILGGGDGCALREVLKYKDVKSVTLVDLDEMFVNFCKTNPIVTKINNNSLNSSRLKLMKPGGLTEDGDVVSIQLDYEDDATVPPTVTLVEGPDINLYTMDADKFIESIKGKWPVVIIDFPDPNGVELAKLYSKEFYSKLNNVLTAGGVYVQQATSPIHARSAYLMIKKTMEAAGFQTLPFHDNIPSFGEWGWIIGWHDFSRKELYKRINRKPFLTETKYLTKARFIAATVFGKGELDYSDVKINSRLEPNLLQAYNHDSWIGE